MIFIKSDILFTADQVVLIDDNTLVAINRETISEEERIYMKCSGNFSVTGNRISGRFCLIKDCDIPIINMLDRIVEESDCSLGQTLFNKGKVFSDNIIDLNNPTEKNANFMEFYKDSIIEEFDLEKIEDFDLDELLTEQSFLEQWK